MQNPVDIINEIKSFLIKCSNCSVLDIQDELDCCGRCKHEQGSSLLFCKNCLYESDNYQCCYDCYDYNSEDSIGYDIVDWLTF